MREELKELIDKTICFKYSIPNEDMAYSVNISTHYDDCFTYSSNDDLVELIYQSILDYSYNEFELTEEDLDVLFARALVDKIKYDESQEELTKRKYGFYGEVLLFSILYKFYHAKPLISRGYFYNPLENSETKGYDAYHLIQNSDDEVELWFGEVKFRDSLDSGATDAIKGLEKAFNNTYLSKNIIAINKFKNSFNIENTVIEDILNNWNGKVINIIEQALQYDMTLVYPILLVYPDKEKDYDKKIQSAVNQINAKFKAKDYSLSIPYVLFFIFLPVSEVQKIKKEVIKWIELGKPQI